MLARIRIRGSVRLVYRYYTDPTLFFSGFQDVNKNKFFFSPKFPFLLLGTRYLPYAHSHQSSKMTSYKEVSHKTSEIKVSCLMMEASGSVQLITDPDPRVQKLMDHTAPDPEH